MKARTRSRSPVRSPAPRRAKSGCTLQWAVRCPFSTALPFTAAAGTSSTFSPALSSADPSPAIADQNPAAPLARKTADIRSSIVRLKASCTWTREPGLSPRRRASGSGTAASTGAVEPVPTRTLGSAVNAPAAASAAPHGPAPGDQLPEGPPVLYRDRVEPAAAGAVGHLRAPVDPLHRDRRGTHQPHVGPLRRTREDPVGGGPDVAVGCGHRRRCRRTR